jgi:predicted esterase
MRKKIEGLVKQGQLSQAIMLLEQALKMFPNFKYTIITELTKLYSATKQLDKCLDAWQAGHQSDLFFGLEPGTPPFKAFAGNKRFDDVVAQDRRLRDKANEGSTVVFEVVTPANYDSSKKYPLCIALHGGNSSLKNLKPQWASAKLATDYVVVFVQSYFHLSSETFGWKRLDPKAREEIAGVFEKVSSEYAIDTRKVVVGGISAGAMTAIDLTVNEIVPSRGFIGLCPVTPEEFDLQRVKQAAERGVSGVFVSGDKDFALPKAKDMAAVMEEGGLPLDFTIVPGLGHTYPKDLSQRLDDALTLIETRWTVD